MSITDGMARGLDEDVRRLRDGLDPDNLAAWYGRIVADAVAMAPPWLQDRIKVRRDPILTMRFSLDISRRAIRYFMISLNENMVGMPYSTRLYFLKVRDMVEEQVDRSLV